MPADGTAGSGHSVSSPYSAALPRDKASVNVTILLLKTTLLTVMSVGGMLRWGVSSASKKNTKRDNEQQTLGSLLDTAYGYPHINCLRRKKRKSKSIVHRYV
ncbi:hypothetical protein E2C01_052348 [Portunus trituberculatus]|uniref:Uncharacterized protein n=1 Tax=Portunus trituberculatus TaxID=210409 RepID=A0A5B7GLB5_PORTR|nr:hypothetical protein [Portunus trituberculatus]